MEQHALLPLRVSLITSLGLTLDYLTTHALLRELFTLQEMLSRHAADVAWHQSQQAIGPLPTDYQAMPAVLRDQLAEVARPQHVLKEQHAMRVMPESRNVAQP